MADENKIIDLETLSHFKTKQDLYNLEKFKLKGDSTDLKGAVRYDAAQVLTDEQKAQARANIGIDLDKLGSGSGNSDDGSVVANKFDEEGKLKAEFLPDMAEALKPLDDVVEGYLKPEDNLFYTTAEYTEQIVGEVGKIYLDLGSDKTYRWGGSRYILIGGVPNGGSGDSVVAEDEIIIVTATLTGNRTAAIDEATAEIINDYNGEKPLYIKVEPIGVYGLYSGDKRFVGNYGLYFVFITVNSDNTCDLEMYEIGNGNWAAIPDGKQTYSLATINGVMHYVSSEIYKNTQNIVQKDENGKVPADCLPSYVDDVIEGYYYEEQACFYENIGYDEDGKITSWDVSITGEAGKIYLDLLTNNTYRWSGSQYVRMNPDEYTIATNEDINALFNK